MRMKRLVGRRLFDSSWATESDRKEISAVLI